MTALKHFLSQYQPKDAKEEKIVGILQAGLKLQELARDPDLSDRQRRRLRFELKKWRSHLLLDVFYKLPSLSCPPKKVGFQFREEYESLLNEIAAEFVARILTEFQPELVTQSNSLATKLSIWVNSKLRLKWRILTLISPRRKHREFRVVELFLEWVKRSPDGVSLSEFAMTVDAKNSIDGVWATKYLGELLPKFSTKPPESDLYFVDGDRLDSYLLQRQQQLYTVSIDSGTVPDIIAPPPPPTKEPTLTIKVKRLLTEYRASLQGIQVKTNAECHCFLLLEIFFREQLEDEIINETEITRKLGVKRPTYQSHLERRCLPAFWELVVHTSPVSKPLPQTQQIPLKQYIDTDPQGRLVRCYYTSRKGQEYPHCNTQNLAQQLLFFYTSKPMSWPKLAAFYQLSTDTLVRFWKVKCLFLLSLIAFELESELTDGVEFD